MIHQTLDAVSKCQTNKTHMLCVDGKKVTAGLDKDFGDVDMFHYEESPTMSEKQARLDSEIRLIEELKTKTNGAFAPHEKGLILAMIRDLIFILTMRIKDVRCLKEKQVWDIRR